MLTETPVKTFERIALCLSGGGYRASAFHFGAIDMLDEIKLLDSVKMLSTASGGTITGVAYALSKIEGKPFGEFFSSLKIFLEDVNVVEETLKRSCEILDKDKDAEISLIRLAAGIYEEKLFGQEKKDFGIFLDAIDKPFKELIFNSTELNLGNSFRFRASRRSKAVIGNQNFSLSVSKPVAAKIRLGDIVAASSCFPGVFDPFIFPDDFHFDDPAQVRAALKSGFKHEGKDVSLPLMDGGIFDNQGVDSILMANEKEKGAAPADPIDLFIISDSNPLNEDLFPAPMPTRKIPYLSADYTENPLLQVTTGLANKFRRLANFTIIISFMVLLVAAICLGYMGTFIYGNWNAIFQNTLNAIFTYLVPASIVLAVAVLSVAAIVALFWVKKWIFKAETFIDEHNEFSFGNTPFSLWVFVKKLTLTGLVRLGEARVRSSLALLTDVFLKRVRNLGTKVIMGNPDFSRLVAFNYITDLDSDTNRPQLWSDDAELKPSLEMSETAAMAGKYPTNLWFDSKEDLERVIMTGQMTVCLSILKYLWTRWHIDSENNPNLPRPNSPDSQFNALYTTVRGKWMEFKTGRRTSYERIAPE